MNPNQEEATKDIVNGLAGHVALATNVARVAPEEFRLLTYDRVFTKLLDGGVLASPKAPAPQAPTAKRAGHTSANAPLPDPSGDVELERMFASKPELIANYSHVWKLADRTMQIYDVIRFAREEHAVDGLTEGQIRHILAKLFRTPLPRGTVSGSLANAPADELFREKADGKMRFRLMRAGDNRLAAAIGELSS